MKHFCQFFKIGIELSAGATLFHYRAAVKCLLTWNGWILHLVCVDHNHFNFSIAICLIQITEKKKIVLNFIFNLYNCSESIIVKAMHLCDVIISTLLESGNYILVPFKIKVSKIRHQYNSIWNWRKVIPSALFVFEIDLITINFPKTLREIELNVVYSLWGTYWNYLCTY